MCPYEALIDPTRFRTVRNHMASPRSPITEVLFVAERDLMPKVAALLDVESGLSPAYRRQQWHTLIRNGRVVPEATTRTFGVDTAALADDAICRVLFFPPVYVVHMPGLDLQTSRLCVR